MAELSPALVRRLPQYFRALIKFYGSGKERVSSDELASELGLVSSQVRTDIKALGCTGQRSYGYGIPTLYKRIADILQLSDKFSAIIVGASDMIKALSETEIFVKRGIKLSAVFYDIEGDWDKSDRYACLPVSSLDTYFSEHAPEIMILGGTAESAENALVRAEKAAKKPVVWNFTGANLTSDTLTVKNIHLSDCLMLLCYELGKDERK